MNARLQAHASTLVLIVLILALCASPKLARAEPCPAQSAPLPRLRVGEAAVVSPDIRRVNLRALPAVGAGVVTPLNPRAELTVLAGPSCNGGFNWWRVETARGTRGWVAEGDWIDYYVRPQRDIDRRYEPMEGSCVPFIGRFCAWPR